MVRSADREVRDAQIAGLKRLISARTYETLEVLEDAVDAFLWGGDEEETGDGSQPGSGRGNLVMQPE